MFEKILIMLSCLIGVCPPGGDGSDPAGHRQNPAAEIQSTQPDAAMSALDKDLLPLSALMPRVTSSGRYLASHFAQKRQDWDKASIFLDDALTTIPIARHEHFLSRAMILSMGAGTQQKAMNIARRLVDQDTSSGSQALAYMFLTAEAFKAEDYDAAADYVALVPEGNLSGFVLPLLEGWTKTAKGSFKVDGLLGNTIHIYHALLMSDLLDERKDLKTLIQVALHAEGLSMQDLDRLADGYTLVGEHEKALALYKKALETWPGHTRLSDKIERLESGETPVFFESVNTPTDGLARALVDTASLLFNENSDESAQVFLQTALYLDPDLTRAHLMLGYIAARNDNPKNALVHYERIPPDDPAYREAQRLSADLLEDMGDIDGAVAVLEELAATFDDVDSLIQIGDIYRRHDRFKESIRLYNQAQDFMGGEITAPFWHLHYVRGMAYERAGQWDKAEDDLKKALTFRPDNPLVLNYLGYAWADQGINLDQALDMIRKAVNLKPDDGYITDSLGWVLYRMGRYEEAVPHLERAVELRPYDTIINDHLGDAYWRVGRKREARFQWARAKNYAEEDEDVTHIAQKLIDGLEEIETATPFMPVPEDQDKKVKTTSYPAP